MSTSAMSPLIQAMSVPGFYSDRPDRVELRQTHTSYVFLAGEYVYKVRKPISLPFIDCSTAAKRRELCESELNVNRRLSPEVYCGVLPIVDVGDGQYCLGGASDGAVAVVDFALKMRRLPDERRLDNMVTAGITTLDDIQRIAEHLARFHASSECSEAWTYGSADSVARLITGNYQETAELAADTVTHERLEIIASFSRRYIAEHWEFLNQRARGGRVRDGHGDLRGDSIYLLPEGIRIVDALEFSERLRYGDVASEIAFLAMDLDRLDQPLYSKELVRSYSRASGDADIGRLLPLYKCYRATIRAKVELIKSRQDECPLDERVLAREQARRYLDLACGYTQEKQVAGLLIICGLSGTGKSTLARRLQQDTGFEILASDAERKRLAGVAPNTHLEARYGDGIYRPDFSTRVYQSLIAKAEELLKLPKGVIIDATFLRRDERALVIALGQRLKIPAIFIECRSPHEEVVRRLIERSALADRISDANVNIYLAQVADFEALDEVPPERHLIADTSQDLTGLCTKVEKLIRSC